ncbi:MAG: 3-deoxy-D-arabino-heptulosonate 7-phosphate synthase [Pigmentiphaga sp.]
MPSSSARLLAAILRSVERRYRLPAMPVITPEQAFVPATRLAITMEQARLALATGKALGMDLQDEFTDALARLIHDAMQSEHGDPVFQAMVLRHRLPRIREYASLAAHALQDRQRVRAAVNAIAHPAKLERTEPGVARERLGQLHAAASSGSWRHLRDVASHLSRMTPAPASSALLSGVDHLLQSPSLANLLRLEALAQDDSIREYQALWDRQGPRSSSPEAAAQGRVAQRRGAAAEADAAQALEALAGRLNAVQEPGAPLYRVATSLRVPAELCNGGERAKGEWDVALLRRARRAGPDAWDVDLMVEVKASVDAATNDYPRLLKGLDLLAQADAQRVYAFASRQGELGVSGSSLQRLAAQDSAPGAGLASHALACAVLYCCDGLAESGPRWLGAASRMQLLSASASLEFAGALAEDRPAPPEDLQAVWHLLTESPRWAPVLRQYQRLREVRELMVHSHDLQAACANTRLAP